MPDWLLIATSVATPVLAFLGVVLGQWWTRRTGKELDRWRKREETMRIVRWATELAFAGSEAQGDVAIAVFEALRDGNLLDEADNVFVAEIAGAVARNVLTTPDSLPGPAQEPPSELG